MRSFVYTNVDRDGMLEGPDLDEVAARRRGRARALDLLRRDRLARPPARPARLARSTSAGVIVGKALYEGRFTVAEAQAALGASDAPCAMHHKRVIPCLDVDDGRVVKGTNFVDLRDAGDPVELAARYDAEGADELVFLDITATHEQRDTIVDLARRTADDVFIPFTIGGGIRSVADAQAVLDAGADKVSMNSAAVARPELIGELAERFGSQCVVLAIDAKRERRRRRLGGLRRRRPHARPGRDAVEWAREGVERGAGEILLTSMDRDGTRTATTSTSPARWRARRRPGDRLGRRRRARAPHRGPARRAPTRRSSRSIFHFGEHTVAEAKAPRRGVPVRPDRASRDDWTPLQSSLALRLAASLRARQIVRPSPARWMPGGSARVRGGGACS